MTNMFLIFLLGRDFSFDYIYLCILVFICIYMHLNIFTYIFIFNRKQRWERWVFEHTYICMFIFYTFDSPRTHRLCF